MSSTKKSEEKVLTMRDLEERFTKVVSLALEKGYVINFTKSSADDLLLYTRNKKLPPILHIYMYDNYLSTNICSVCKELLVEEKSNDRYVRALNHYYENLSKKLSQKQLQEIVMRILKKKHLAKSWFKDASIEECNVEILEYVYLLITFPDGKKNILFFYTEWDAR